MRPRWIVTAGLVGITLIMYGTHTIMAASNFPSAVGHHSAPSPLQVLRQLTSEEVAKAALSRSLIPVLRHRWPQIPRTVWLTQVAAIPFGGAHSLPVVVVTRLTGAHHTQELLTYTAHGVVSQPSDSILPTPLAPDNPGLVMGRVDGRPAFLVTSGPLDNRVNLVWWKGNAWHQVWSQVVTTTDLVNIQSVDRFVAGNAPGTTFELVSSPQPTYRPVPSVSSTPYWVVQPKRATLGDPLTIVGCIKVDAGKTVSLNWQAPNGALTQWQVPIAKNGDFSVTQTVPSSINGHPAPAGTYTLSTVLTRWGDSMDVLQGYVSVSKHE